VKIWKVILATLVIFGAGVITGGLLVNHVVRLSEIKNQKKIKAATPATTVQAVTPWQQRNRDLLRRMDRELNLTPEQHDQIEKIILESQERTKVLWKPIAPQMNKETQMVHERMRDQLTPEQRKKFDDLVKPRGKKQDGKPHLGTNALTAEISTNAVAGSNAPVTTN
jgi:Spy/CpxP family protein refolding chaperone